MKRPRKKRKRSRPISSELRRIRAEEYKIGREEKKLEELERNILTEEKKIEAFESKILEEEHEILLSLGTLKVKKEHIFDFFKIVGGALVGTSFGAGLVSTTEFAASLPWLNVLGIFLLSFVIGGALIYKAEKDHVDKKSYKKSYIALRLIYIWLIALVVGGFSGFLFLSEPVEFAVFMKVLLVGSYPALAGALGFNFV